MRWILPWRRRRPHEGARAVKAAEEHYKQTLSAWPAVLEVSEQLREYRERNHFAESVEKVWRERR